MKKYFIYKITSPSGKVYIGQSLNPNNRILQYKWKTVERQALIARSIKKYGYENHIIEIFPKSYTKSEVNIEEIRLIKIYKELGISLNITDGGDTSSKVRQRQIIKFDLNGEKLEEFLSLKQASDSINCTSDVLCKALSSKLYYAKNFLWCYKDNYEKGEIPKWTAGNKGKSTVAKIVYQFDLDGNFINNYPSAESAGRALNIKATNISLNLRGGVRRCQNYIFSYLDKVEKYTKTRKKKKK